tara:strand:- start:15929 stop:16195 length:267 start_codon:yes stop_codon:yes gene_type:complete
MIKFICKTCDATKELMKATIKVIDGKVRTEQAKCECGEWMVELEKEFDGFPSLIRTEESLSRNKKRDKLWDEAKETLTGEHKLDKDFK